MEKRRLELILALLTYIFRTADDLIPKQDRPYVKIMLEELHDSIKEMK